MILFIFAIKCNLVVYIKKYNSHLYMSHKKIDKNTVTYSTFPEALQFALIRNPDLTSTFKVVTGLNFVLNMAEGSMKNKVLILFTDYFTKNQMFRIERANTMKNAVFLLTEDLCITYDPVARFFTAAPCEFLGTNENQMFEIISVLENQNLDLGLFPSNKLDEDNIKRKTYEYMNALR